jgi:enamine deaminase RidA (YjgF/YER057c/UK114 family)
MSETTDRPMTVKAARRLLSDTRRVSPERVREAEELLRALHAKRPGLMAGGGVGVASCANCGGGVWSLHSDGDDERWACSRCHREPMSAAEGKALKDAQREQAHRLAAEKARVAAAAPKPREALASLVEELIGAQAEEARLEAAGATARDQLATARVALDSAEAALPAAREKIASAAVEALLDPAAAGRKPRTTVIEAASLEMARNGLELATTAAQTIEDMLADARYQMRRLEKRHREAALDVLRDECAPLLIARATEARHEFVAASRGLRWLEKSGVAPSSLIAAELKWSWHHSPEVWQAGSQPGPDFDAALKALLRDPHAPVELT